MQGSGCQSGHHVPMEEQVFRHGSESAEEAQGDGERVVTVQEDCGGADASKYGLKGCDRKNAIGPAEKRELVDYSRKEHGISLRQACILFSLHFSVYYYKPKPNEDHLVRDALSSFGEGYQNSFLYCLENQ